MKKSSIFFGSAMLTIASLISVLICAVFRIPLFNIIGVEGMAFFQLAFPICALMSLISTTGLPSAVAHLVSVRMAKGDRQSVQTIFYLALGSFAAVGIVLTVGLWLLSPSIAKSAGMIQAASVLQWAMPMIFLCLGLAALRGYFQGLSMAMPGALSQLIGQVVKLVLGLILAWLWSDTSPERAALGGILGVTIGEIISFLLMAVMYMLGFDQMQEMKAPPIKARIKSRSKVTLRIWQKGLLLSLGAAIIPIILMIDSFSGLRLVGAQSDAAIVAAPGQFAIYSGAVFPLVFFVAVIVMVFVNANSSHMTRLIVHQDFKALRQNVESTLRLSFALGLAAAVALWILAEPILGLLFGSAMDESQIALGAMLLKVMSISALFASMGQSALTVLQNTGRELIAAIIVVFAIIVKVVTMQIAVRFEGIGIMGLPFSTALACGVVALVATAYVVQVTRLQAAWWMYIPKSLVAATIMGAVLYLLQYFLPVDVIGANVICIICVFVGLIVYLAAAFVLQLITLDDIKSLPVLRNLFERPMKEEA